MDIKNPMPRALAQGANHGLWGMFRHLHIAKKAYNGLTPNEYEKEAACLRF